MIVSEAAARLEKASYASTNKATNNESNEQGNSDCNAVGESTIRQDALSKEAVGNDLSSSREAVIEGIVHSVHCGSRPVVIHDDGLKMPASFDAMCFCDVVSSNIEHVQSGETSKPFQRLQLVPVQHDPLKRCTMLQTTRCENGQ